MGRDYYLNKCWAGSVRLFHLHHPVQLPEGVTVELRMNQSYSGGVSVGQVSQRRNLPPPPAATAAAGALRARYAHAMRQPQAPRHAGEYYIPGSVKEAAA